MSQCELCQLATAPVYRNDKLSVILVDDAAYPGFCRVIWNEHVKEMSDLAPADRMLLNDAVWHVELALRAVMAPGKVNVASLGNNVLSIRPGRQFGPGTRDTSPRFTLRDADALSRLSVIASVSPQVQTSQTVVAGNLNTQSSVNGVAAAQLEVGGWTLAKGRVFSPVEEKAGAAVCVIGETVRKALFGSGDPLDQTIRIKGVACSVIGPTARGKASGAPTPAWVIGAARR